MTTNKENNLHVIAQTIYDKKGENIIGLDISEISSTVDSILIAEGAIDRHVVAIGKAIREEMKSRGEAPVRVEGLDSGEWVVLDFVDFMVHIFTPQMREMFQLERLFSNGKLINLELQET